jgi:nitrate reductase NapE component
MSLDFINRIIKTSLIMAIILFPFLAVYAKTSFGVAFMLGSLWGCLNLLAIKLLVIQAIKPGKKNIVLLLFFIFVKFPIIYLLGYLLVIWSYPPLFGLVWGFSSIMIVTVLKVLSRQLLQLDANKPRVKAL